MRFVSPGPIFFRQERVGLNGRKFRLYKFRTMHVSAPETSHQAHLRQLMASQAPMRKLDAEGDPRLIPGARWLRASGFDELPQVLNVLRGEMTLVGPRPCLPYEFEHYTPAQRRRCDVVPGLTGLWQVSGKNRTTFEEMINLDLEYARCRSFTTDVSIVVRTVPALLSQLGEVRAARRAHSTRTGPAAPPVTASVSTAPAVRPLAKA